MSVRPTGGLGRGPGGTRSAWISAALAAVATLGVWVWVARQIARAGDPVGPGGPSEGEQIRDTVLVLGSWWIAAVAALAWHAARTARGDDGPTRLVGLTSGPDEWGAAMRAELAAIDDRAERRRFALGCAAAALHRGARRSGRWLAAGGVLVVFAVTTVVASRRMLAADPDGILVVTALTMPVSFLAGAVAAWRARSFGSGVATGVVVFAAAVAGTMIAAVPESVAWWRDEGVYLLDGDLPSSGIPDAGAAVRDALQGIATFSVMFYAPFPVLGALTGAALRRSRRGDGVPAAADCGGDPGDLATA